MLRWSAVWRCMVSASALHVSAAELNRLLEQKYTSDGHIPREDLKAFLRERVMPILQGTTLDRRNRTSSLRRHLARLVRDASFSAYVLHASPTGAFVQSLVHCLVHDHERMRFVPHLTSAQASHIMSNLAALEVKEAAVYSTLVTRVQYTNLADVARAAAALMRAGLHELLVVALVPLYAEERWSWQEQSRRTRGESYGSDVAESASTPTTSAANVATVSDAVYVLRALSKSARVVTEVHRKDGVVTLLSEGSVRALCDALLRFLFEPPQRHTLRASHWLTVARALAHFPVELRRLPETAPYAELVTRQPGAELTCEDVARVALRMLFVHNATNSHDDADGDEGALDMRPHDAVQALMLVQSLYDAGDPQRRQWLDMLIAHILRALPRLAVGELVPLLHAMRQLDARPLVRTVVDSVVIEVGQRLEAAASTTECAAAQTVPFARLVQFAAALSIFRVARCDGFVRYVAHTTTTTTASLPPRLSMESAVALLQGLVAVSAGAAEGQTAALHIAERVCANYADGTVSAGGLFAQSPLLSVKLWRALVGLQLTPTPALLDNFFGPATTPSPRGVSGFVLFDLARLLAHHVREPGRVSAKTQAILWHRGVCDTLLPLLVECTASSTSARDEVAPPTAPDLYLPRAWSCGMDTVALYVDVNLDWCEAAVMVRRLCEAAVHVERLVAAATTATARALAEVTTSPAQLRRGLAPTSLAAVAVRNWLTTMLVWEFVLYHAAWQVTRPTLGPCASEAETSATAPDAHVLAWLKQRYVAFLHSSVTGTAALVSTHASLTPLELIRLVFAWPCDDLAAAPGRKRDAVSLLRRAQVLEITGSLPFAIALVITAGPVNELFCEHAFPIMTETDEDDV